MDTPDTNTHDRYVRRQPVAISALAGQTVSVSDARAEACALVGTVLPRAFASKIAMWWDFLIAAKTPEEKLGCQRMIDAYGYASGLHDHERGKALAAENVARNADKSRRDCDEAALARWRR